MTSCVDKAACRMIEHYQAGGGGIRFFGIDCNFEPTCSEYARQAIMALGLLKAIPVSLERLRRCNEPDVVGKVLDPFVSATGD